ncbi:hypothetical protein [Labrys sp. 22185]|uniref:hypothetical protein n=1 Tax=Labrys sp. 22185 TaxID=3453888 RepID=UPI003F82C963
MAVQRIGWPQGAKALLFFDRPVRHFVSLGRCQWEEAGWRGVPARFPWTKVTLRAALKWIGDDARSASAGLRSDPWA